MSLSLFIRRALLVFIVVGAMEILPTPLVWAQETEEPANEASEERYGSGAGFQVLLTNNGFGLGGYYSRQLGTSTSFFMEASLGAGKDERELKYFSRYGNSIIPNKQNYLLMLPIRIGFQKRLFAEYIEDNFRPYIHLSGGPSLGWVYPYYNDIDGNNRFDESTDQRYDLFNAFPKGGLHFGLGGSIAFGAYFGKRKKVAQGVRFGYAFSYFFEGVELLEPTIKTAQNYFHSPVIIITFGRLF